MTVRDRQPKLYAVRDTPLPPSVVTAGRRRRRDNRKLLIWIALLAASLAFWAVVICLIGEIVS